MHSQQPTLLAIDTSTQVCVVALSHQGHSYIKETASSKHASIVLALIEQVMQEAQVSAKDMQAVAYSKGPGSFMGVRTAASVAQSLTLCWDVPGLSFSTLQAVAQACYLQHGCEHVLAAWDARMQSIYWGSYTLQNAVMQSSQDDALYSYANWPFITDASYVGAGNAWSLLQDAVQLSDSSRSTIGAANLAVARSLSAEQDLTPSLDANAISKIFPERCFAETIPSAAAILAVATAQWHAGQRLQPEQMQPLYLRAAVTTA